MYIVSVIRNILSILRKGYWGRYKRIQVVYLFNAIFQVAGVASIGPFISVLSNPGLIESNFLLSYFYQALAFDNHRDFVVFLAFTSLGIIVFSNAFSALSTWLTFRFTVGVGSSLQRRLYHHYLMRDYIDHKMNNYNSKISMVSQETLRFVYMLLQPFLLLISQALVALIIAVGLIILDPILALSATLVVGGSYLLMYLLIRKKVNYLGKVIFARNRMVQKIQSESYSGIKDLKLKKLEDFYKRKFDKENVRGLNAQAFIAQSGELPRYLMEAISFSAILVLAIILVVSGTEFSGVVSVLSIYALAGYKLLPTMQQMYKSVSSLSGHGDLAKTLLQELPEDDTSSDSDRRECDSGETVKSIELDNVSYQYPGADNFAVKDVSLSLKQGRIYSIVGPSGSGKSTVTDLLLFLLEPTSGGLKVNGEQVEFSNSSGFQGQVGYVGQSIFILDDNVIKNVAFGYDESNVDLDRVWQCLELANAAEFVRDLPHGIETNLAQDGRAISGGQKQRIGIARALYNNARILVLDEPTSALDIESEFNFMKTMESLKSDRIIFIVSHRPAAIKMSDHIILMDSGGIVQEGSLLELAEKDHHFRELMNKSSIT